MEQLFNKIALTNPEPAPHDFKKCQLLLSGIRVNGMLKKQIIL